MSEQFAQPGFTGMLGGMSMPPMPPNQQHQMAMSMGNFPPIHAPLPSNFPAMGFGVNDGCTREQLLQKVALLERKIKAKDQLFDDALTSTFAGCQHAKGNEFSSLMTEMKIKVEAQRK